MNRRQRRSLAKAQISHERQLAHERQEQLKKEKEQFLKMPWYKRLKFFYKSIPSKKGKVVFWIWSPVIFTVFFPLIFLIDLIKLNIAWKYAIRIVYSFKNGK